MIRSLIRNLPVVFESLLLLLTFNCEGENVVSLGTLDWPPYLGESLQDKGGIHELVREAFARGGYKVEIRFMPWVRAVHLAQKGGLDGFFPEYSDAPREKEFYLSSPFPSAPLVLMKLKSRRIQFNRLDDLKGYSIGVVRGYVNTKEFDSASYLTRDETNDDETNLRKLIGGRLDLVAIDLFVARDLLAHSRELEAGADKLEALPKILGEKTLAVCINKTVPHATEIIHAFNTGLKQMQTDGTLKKLYAKYGMQRIAGK